ncbi:unnamed protein product [Triticum turgidum subsp. durum]|uniref:NB-ARC domain-containing protein n=1 Tax=Triticum turgidum subsp. durum TaxID=4567 RepID=A0A9R1AEL9_TRITD|nr:unnamed protein product [Triticum turgidum subsp. durum]
MAALMEKLAAHEDEELCRVGDEVALLRDRIRLLQAIIRTNDANRAGRREGQSRVLGRQMRDSAFGAEDALDDVMFQHQVALKSQGCRNSRTQVRYFIGFFARIMVRRRLCGQITSIMSTLQNILDQQMNYMVEQTPSVILASSTTAIAAWRDDLENAMGFDKDMEVLKRMLVHKDKDSLHRMFISIVGESGAGKNTLIKKVLHDAICSNTDVLIRYDMQPGSSMGDLLTHVYQIALGQLADHYHEDEGEVEDKLSHLLAGKSYILILGGISSKTTLNHLRASLPDDNNNGSRVVLILDTENEEVAWHANTMNKDGNNGVHMLTCLDRARSWQLFSWKVLRKGQHDSSSSIYEKGSNQKEEEARDNYGSSHEVDKNEEEQEEKKDDRDNYDPSHKKGWNKEEDRDNYRAIFRHDQVGVEEDDEKYRYENCKRTMHEVTRGYPMAIVLLAGLLRFKERPVQWDEVLQELGTSRNSYYQHQMCNTRRAMETIFWASFEDLPEDLKSCYLYLAGYPEDKCQHADEIIRMWIAEGFINNKRLLHGKSLEDVGHDYLKELVLRCLVELKETKPGGGIMRVRVHRSILGLLRSEVVEVSFMDIVHNVTDDVLVPPLVRRIFIESDNNAMYSTHQKFMKLRSFICHINENKHKEAEAQWRCTGNKSLHEGLKFLRWSKFLRVVSVKGLRLKEVPDELGDMIHLRYLCIDCPDLCYLPPGIGRLPNLQTLDVSNTQVEEIHRDFWKIKTLRHVLAKSLTLPTTMTMPAGGEEDDEEGGELQTLHGVKPAAPGSEGEWGIRSCPLDRMTNLSSLDMHSFQYATHGGPALGAALHKMHLLEHLKLQGDEIPSCVFTEPGLRRLQTMVLNGTVKWDDIAYPTTDPLLLRKVRPNLIQLKLNDAIKVPQTIRDQLGEILVQEEN